MKSFQAIEALLNGQRVARSGWNGKGMFVYQYKFVHFKPVLVLHTAKGDEQPGWVFSQDDLFAKDWVIYE